MPNSNSIFDIFDYLGIPVTDNLETVQKALDDLPVSKMADLRKMPEFSELRKLLYSKRATPDYLSYVQSIKASRQSNRQNNNRQDHKSSEQSKEDQKNTLIGCSIFILIGFCLFSGIGSLFKGSDATPLSKPEVKIIDVDAQKVIITWDPVEHADYYVLENENEDLPEDERVVTIRNKTDYIINRHDSEKTNYTIIACSDSDSYSPSSPANISIDPSYNNSQGFQLRTPEPKNERSNYQQMADLNTSRLNMDQPDNTEIGFSRTMHKL